MQGRFAFSSFVKGAFLPLSLPEPFLFLYSFLTNLQLRLQPLLSLVCSYLALPYHSFQVSCWVSHL